MNKKQKDGDYDFSFVEHYRVNGSESIEHSLLPGQYKLELLIDGQVVEDLGEVNATKAEEKKGSFYGIDIEWPRANVIGSVVNASTGEVVHKKGMKVKIFNCSKTYEFEYDCVSNTYGYTYNTTNLEDFSSCYTANGYRQTLGNVWDERFKFVFSGWNGKNQFNNTANGYMLFDAMRCQPAIEEGSYTVQLIDDLGQVVYEDSLEVSKANQQSLYNVKIDFPLCNVKGVLKTDKGTVVHEEEWKVKLVNLDDSTKNAEFSYVVLDEATGNYKECFEFRGLGQDRPLGENWRNEVLPLTLFTSRSSEGVKYGSSYYSRGVWPGRYSLEVYYNGNKIRSSYDGETLVVSKEAEAAGDLSNLEVIADDIYSDVKFTLRDAGLDVDVSNAGKAVFSFINVDGGTADRSKAIDVSFACPEMSYSNLICLGWHGADVYADGYFSTYSISQGRIKIEPTGMKNLAGESVYLPAGSQGGIFDVSIFDSSKLTTDENGFKRMTVEMPYWLWPAYKKFSYVDEHVLANETYEQDGSTVEFSSIEVPTEVTVDNLTQTETETVGGYEFGTRYIRYSGNYSLNRDSLKKSGEYELTLKRSDTGMTLDVASFVLSGQHSSVDEVLEASSLSSDLGMKTLNMNLVIWREDLNKYQIIPRDDETFSHSLSWNVNGTTVDSYYKNGSRILSHYDSSDMKITTRGFSEDSSELVAWKQPKVILPQLANEGEYFYKTRFGGFSDRADVKLLGLYEGDISRDFSSSSKPSQLDPISIKSLLKTYVIPTLSLDGLELADAQALLQAAQEHFGEEFTKPYVFGKSDFTSLDQHGDVFLDDILSTMPHKTIKSYVVGEERLLSSIGESKLLESKGFKLEDLDIENPNPQPIHYKSLVVDELCLNVFADIKVKEADGTSRIHNFSYFNIPLLLKVYRDGVLEAETWAKKTYFYIPFLKSGKHDFKVYQYGTKEIYSETKYVYDRTNIEILIDASRFTSRIVEGSVKWNSSKPTDIVHITAKDQDNGNMLYSGSMFELSNGVNYKKAVLDTYCGSSSDEEALAINGMQGSWPQQSSSSTSWLPSYGTSTAKSFSQYKLPDLVPGRYSLKFYVTPTLLGRTGQYSSWGSNGDASFCSYLTSGVDSIVKSSSSFTFEVPASYTALAENYASLGDLVPFRLLVDFTFKHFGTSSTQPNEVWSSQQTGWIELPFTWSKTQDGKYVLAISAGSRLPEDAEDSLKDVIFTKATALFGFEAGSLAETVSSSTTSLPEVQLSKMLTQETTVKFNKFYRGKKAGAFTYVLKDSNSQEVVLSSGLNYTEDYGSGGEFSYYNDMTNSRNSQQTCFALKFYGLKNGDYSVTLRSADGIALTEDLQFSADAAVKTINKDIPHSDIIFKFVDASLSNAPLADATRMRLKRGSEEIDIAWISNAEVKTYGLLSNVNFSVDVEIQKGIPSYGSWYDREECTEPYTDIIKDVKFSENGTRTITLPWQYFTLTAQRYDAKTGQQSSFDDYSSLSMQRISPNDTETSYSIGKDNARTMVKSGQYGNVVMTYRDQTNGNVISLNLEKQTIDSSKTIPLFYNLETMSRSGIGNVQLKKKTSSSGATVTSDCTNVEVTAYDFLGSLAYYKTAPTNGSGLTKISANDSFLSMKYCFKVQGYAMSNAVDLTSIENARKTVLLVLDGDSKTVTASLQA